MSTEEGFSEKAAPELAPARTPPKRGFFSHRRTNQDVIDEDRSEKTETAAPPAAAGVEKLTPVSFLEMFRQVSCSLTSHYPGRSNWWLLVGRCDPMQPCIRKHIPTARDVLSIMQIRSCVLSTT